MHNVQGAHVSHFAYEELGDVNQLQTNRHHHGVTPPIQLMLLYTLTERQNCPINLCRYKYTLAANLESV